MTNPKNILVATDFSTIGQQAVDYAFELAKPLGAKLYLFHVCEPLSELPDDVMIEGNAIDQVERVADKRLAQLQKAQGDDHPPVERIVEVGVPAVEILHSAARLRVDLIVMGTHGRRGLKRALLGSVAEEVLRSAPCPVLVVRPPEREPKPAP